MSRPLFSLTLVGLALGVCASDRADGADASLSLSVDSWKAADGESYHAIRTRATKLPAVEGPQDHLVIVDTSASQVGEHRQQALQVLDAFLAALPAQDRVKLFATDVDTREMTSGFAAAGSETLQTARKQLARQVPLGAGNLQPAFEAAVKNLEQGRRTSILYVGDGMSTADLLDARELHQLLSQLSERRVAVHAYAVGPQLDLPLLGAIAHRTGGRVLFDHGKDVVDRRKRADHSPAAVGRELAAATHAPVLYPTRFELANDGLSVHPEQPLPLRSDRETIYLAHGTAETLQVQTGDETVSLEGRFDMGNASGGHTFLASAWRQFAEAGSPTPFAGSALLQAAREGFNDRIDNMVRAGERALALGEFDQADEIAAAIRELDPSNVQAKTLAKAALERKKRPLETVALVQPDVKDEARQVLSDDDADDDFPGAPQAGETDDLIGQEIDKRRIATERMQVLVEDTIRTAQQIAQRDPEQAQTRINRTLTAVETAENLIPTAKADLIKTLQKRLRAYENIAELKRQEEIRRAERLAQIEAEKRMVEAMLLEEERLEQLIDQVRALLDEAYHGRDEAYEDAEAVAEVAVDLRPGEGTAEAARFTAEAAGHVGKIFRLRALRQDRYLEALYQVELSHVPFPDEPPIRWPSAPVWKALTERRRKWAAVDLKKHSPNEERIRRELRNTTEIEFNDLPLSEVVQYLSDLHDIPIILDEIALEEEGLSPDEPINRVISGVTLRSALKIILEPLGLTYVIRDEVMKITNEATAESFDNLSVRVYPVGDLVIPVQPVGSGPGGFGQLGGVGGGALGGGLGGLGGLGGGLGGLGGLGGGLGGLGGLGFSIPPERVPRPRKAQPPREAEPRPRDVQDDELDGILDNILGDQTSHLEAPSGQAFAQVQDDVRFDNQALKKKAPLTR